MKPFTLSKHRRFPLVFLVACLCTLPILFFVSIDRRGELFLPIVAFAAGLTYFLYNQHHQETRLFTELFREFNARYDRLNEELNRIAGDKQVTVLSRADRQVLFDYFNLCAEEYLYFKNGYIDKEVWESWANGMLRFASAQHICDLWKEEVEGGSYYGFNLGLLEKHRGRPARSLSAVAKS